MFGGPEQEPDTAKDNNYIDGDSDMNKNLVIEDKIKSDSNYIPETNKIESPSNGNIYDENSLHLGEIIDQVPKSDPFIKKEAEYTQKIEDFIVSKTGQINIKYSWDKIAFTFNYFLMLSTFIECILQRYDVPTLSLCFIIFFIKIEFFSHKHLYKFLFYLLATISLDIFVLIDIFPVSNFYNYIYKIGRRFIFRIRFRKYNV